MYYACIVRYISQITIEKRRGPGWLRGTYKVRNEIERKGNETKRNEINEHETKRNQ